MLLLWKMKQRPREMKKTAQVTQLSGGKAWLEELRPPALYAHNPHCLSENLCWEENETVNARLGWYWSSKFSVFKNTHACA